MAASPHAIARTLSGLLMLVGLLPAAVLGLASQPAAGEPAAATRQQVVDLDVYESRVLALVNQRRTAHGRRPVRRVSGCVDRLSERWAAHLAETGDLYHRDQFVVLDRCHMQWAGEAIARGTAMLPAQAVRHWMHSPSHRAVILKRRANRAGIGVRLDGLGRVVLVLNFTDTRG